jgi:flagellar hook protein FlgE
MTFNVALSGLKGASTDLEVTGNNIANASTVGFKRSRTEFVDAYSNSFLSGNANKVGSGTQTQKVRQIFSQGNISATSNGLDLAINGKGYFVVNDNGQRKYTRAGQFGVDRSGYLVNNSGMKVQGFQADAKGNISGVISDIKVNNADLAPTRTTNVDTQLNLDASASVLAKRGTTVTGNGTDVSKAIAGTQNGYTAQTVNFTLAGGTTATVNTAANETAGSIAAKMTAINGVDATAQTTSTITSAGFNNASGTMKVTINGINFTPTSLSDLGNKINASALPGVTAVLSGTNLKIIQNQGADLQFGFTGTAGDSFAVQGNSTPASTQTLNTANNTATVGGQVTLTMDDGVAISNGSAPATPVFDNFVGAPFINNQFDPTDPGTYNHATSTSIYDSQGNSHVLTMYFVKQSDTASTQPNTWQMHVQIDNKDVGDPLIGNTPTDATYTVVFNNDGSLNTNLSDKVLVSNWTPVDSTGQPNGAKGPLNVVNGGTLPIPDPPTSSNFQIDISKTTQFGSPFSVNDLQQNGFTTGRLAGLDVDGTGVLFARYTNGQSLTLSQVSLANFNNEEGLSPVGQSAWTQSYASGDPIIGTPGSSTLGTLKSSSLEDSNVDLSNELVKMIVAQRNFQANSKTIETANAVTQTILKI